MEKDPIRDRSLGVFRDIKPICIDLLHASTIPDESESSIEYLLQTLSVTLYKPLEQDDSSNYVISTSLADYIFLPLSNLLKRSSLSEGITRYILNILAYLLNYAWSHNLDEDLLDQLGPLVVFLTYGTLARGQSVSAAQGKLVEFIESSTRALLALMNCFPRNYFSIKDNTKRLSVLGDSTTLILEFMETLDSSSEPLIQDILYTLSRLYLTRVSSEQASFVFPGLVSKVIKFYLNTKNLHSPTVICIVSLLRELAVKVFADNTLQLKEIDSTVLQDTDSLRSLLDEGSSHESISLSPRFNIEPSAETHRNDSWLKATSKQFKIGLLTFVKAALLGPNSKTRLAGNKKLANSFIDLISDILRKCFRSLFHELVIVTFDIATAIYHASTDSGEIDDPSLLLKLVKVYTFATKTELGLLYGVLMTKTEHLINSQLESALNFARDDKLSLTLNAVYVHIHLCQEILLALMKPQQSLRDLKASTLRNIATALQSSIVHPKSSGSLHENQAFNLTPEGDLAEEEANTLDNIVLPPQINAKNIASSNQDRSLQTSSQYVTALHRINYDVDTIDKDVNSLSKLLQLYSKSSELRLQKLLLFLGVGSESDLETFITVLMNNENDVCTSESSKLLKASVSLWITNNLYKNSSAGDLDTFDVNDFLNFEPDPELEKNSEANYLLLEAAKGVFISTQAHLDKSDSHNEAGNSSICEMLQSVALESLGVLSLRFDKVTYQTEVLMDYLYPLLESFAQSPESSSHLQAKVALKKIADAHYQGSLLDLILENADYLIDSLSLKFSVSSGLTPALSGILLVVLRISGVQLLQSNQLQDIIAEMFIAIDSYHGYSVLVENFFVVFQEIILRTKEMYKQELSDLQKLPSNETQSAYRPWGLLSVSDMLSLIKTNEDRVELPAGFDSQKEYFKRKPGVPFSDQVDSDDEDEIENENETDSEIADKEPVGGQSTEEEDKWDSFVAKNIYSLVEQIFKYGCQMLNHPSTKLKIQVLRTLREAYPLLCTNYRILMPLLADYFPALLVLCVGTSSLSEHWRNQVEPQHLTQLIEPSLELLDDIIAEDSKHEKFMSSRFIDVWNAFKDRSPIISAIVKKDRNFNEPKERALETSAVSARIKNLYSRILLRGLKVYERTVPDLLAHEIVRVCSVLGIDGNMDLGRDVRNHLWVLQNC